MEKVSPLWKTTTGFFYQSDAKYDSQYDEDDDEITVNPIAFEYNTVNMAL